MTLNIDKKYNDLLDFLGMSDYEKKKLLRTIFKRDIQDNYRFLFKEKPIYPTPKENGFLAMDILFNHLTSKMIDKKERHRIFDTSRSIRLHWIKYHIDQMKKDKMLYFSTNDNRKRRTYIYDIQEKYVIVLEPLRNEKAYYLLTAYHLEGKDNKRNKIMSAYNKRRLNEVL